MYEEIKGAHVRVFLDGVVRGITTEKVHSENRHVVADRISALLANVAGVEVVEYEKMPWLRYFPGQWQLSERSPLSFTRGPVKGIPPVGELEDKTLFVYGHPTSLAHSGFRHIGNGAEIGIANDSQLIYVKYSGNEPKSQARVAHEVIIVPKQIIFRAIEQRRQPVNKLYHS